MPGGKAISSGGMIRRPNLADLDIATEKLLHYRLKSRKLAFRSPAEIREQVREAVEVYIGSHLGTQVATVTERNRILSKISVAANKLVAGADERHWRAKLSDAVRLLDVNGRSDLHRSLTAAARGGPEAAAGTRGIIRLLQIGDPRYPSEPGDTWLIRQTATIAGRRPFRQKGADPFLRYLVMTLAPLWTEVTGRTALSELTNDALINGAETPATEYPFAIWLDALVTSGIELAEVGSASRHPTNWEIRPSSVLRILRA